MKYQCLEQEGHGMVSWTFMWEKRASSERWERKERKGREGDSDVEMRTTAGIRRVQVGQVWRTEVPCGPRKPASALRPPGPRATSLSVLSLATTIYHLRSPVIPSHLRHKRHRHARTGTHIQSWERRARVYAYNCLQTHLLRSYSFIENYWLRYVQDVLSWFASQCALRASDNASQCESRKEDFTINFYMTIFTSIFCIKWI